MRVRSLDGLRGVAALSVVLGHLRLIVLDTSHDPLVHARGIEQASNVLGVLGSHAVWLFFVLSGIVLAMLATRREGFPWGGYLLSRIARLYLPTIAAVVFAYLTIVAVPRHTGGYGSWIDSHPASLSWNGLAADLTLVDGTSGSLSPLWSLQWEVLFSVLLALYLAVQSRVRPIVTLAAAVLLAAIGAAVNSQILMYLPMFAIGVALCLWWPRLNAAAERISARGTAVAAVVAVVGVVVAVVLNLVDAATLARVGITGPAATFLVTLLSLVGIVLLCLLVAFNAPLRAAFESRVLQWLGMISFSVYLVHEPIVIGVVRLWNAGPVALLLALALSLIAADLFSRFVERPAHRFSQKLRTAPVLERV